MKISKRLFWFIVIGSASIIATAVYLIPSNREIALMEMSDHDYKYALLHYLHLSDDGDNSIDVVAPLVNLNIYYGEIDKSIERVTKYIAAHPKTIEGRKQLAALYKSSQRYNDYCDTLEELQTIAPSPKYLRDLANTYDFLGRYPDEIHALARLVESHSSKDLADDDYLKLASFYHINSQNDAAINLLADYINDQSFKVDPELVFLYAGLLLEEKKPDAALSFSKKFLDKYGKEEDAVTLSSLFEEEQILSSAYDILAPYLKDIDKSQELAQQIIGLLLEQKRDDEAFKILETQFEHATLSHINTVRLADLAIKQNNYGFLSKFLKKTDLRLLPEDKLLVLSGYSMQSNHPELALIMLANLGSDYLQSTPLLSALLNLAATDTPQALQTLLHISPDIVISTTSKIVVAQAYMLHSMDKEAFELLQRVPVMDLLDILSPAEIASLYLSTHQAEKGAQMLVDARSTSPDETRALIDVTLMLLDIAGNETAKVQVEMAHYTDKDIDVFSDALDIALLYGRTDLGVLIAKRLNQAAPDEINKIRLADALLQNNQFAEALPLLKISQDSDAETRDLYIDTIEGLIARTGLAHITSLEKQQISSFVQQAAMNPQLSSSETMQLAYLLDEVGLKTEAEKAFIKAVGKQTYNGHDVRELLDFWQDNPSEVSKQWINKHVQASSGDERLFWISALADMGATADVIRLVENDWQTSSKLTDIYIEALLTIDDKTKLTQVLDKSISENEGERLKQLATIATDEDLEGVAQKGWSKILTKNPDDSAALLGSGMSAYQADEFDKAEPFLAQYLKNNKGDYHINYAYGAILQEMGRQAEAQRYLSQALAQTEAITDKDDETSIDEAHLLYMCGKKAQAISEFKQLIEKQGGNDAIRAEFVEILMEDGQYDEASHILAH